MMDRDHKLRQAEHRLELRQLEVEIQRLRHEQRFYRKMKFGPDLQEMQLVELLERKRDCEQRLRGLQHRSRGRHGSRVGLASWVMLSPMLVAMGFRSLFDRGSRTSAGAR